MSTDSEQMKAKIQRKNFNCENPIIIIKLYIIAKKIRGEII